MGLRLSLLTRPGVAAFLALLGACTSPPRSATPSAPAWLPDVEVATLSGERTSIPHVAGGRIALVNLWATWCDACAKEMDALNRLDAKASAEGGAVVIGVAVGEEPERVAAFVERRGLHYVQLVDERYALADALGGPRRLPTTLVVDRSGRVVYRGEALDTGSLQALRRALSSDPTTAKGKPDASL